MNDVDQNTSETRKSPPGNARLVLSAILIFLAMGGIAVMQFASAYALVYWLSMVPIFGIVSGVSVRHHLAVDDPARENLSRRLLLHWVSLAVALLLVFLMHHLGRLSAESAGLVSLVLLGHTCVLAGVHYDWHLLMLGGLILATAVVGVFAENLFWVLLAPALLVFGVIAKLRHRAPVT